MIYCCWAVSDRGQWRSFADKRIKVSRSSSVWHADVFSNMKTVIHFYSDSALFIKYILLCNK